MNSTAEEMDQADEELKVTITHIWPLQARKVLNLLVPPKNTLNKGKYTVGKVYAGLLILESWRNTRFGQIDSGLPVSFKSYFNKHYRILYYIIQILLPMCVRILSKLNVF